MKISCLLIDRINKADDNAEFLYYWLRDNKPEISIYFGISAESPDWKRLSDAGFNLIDLDNTFQYRDILSNVTHILVGNLNRAKMENIAPKAIRIFLQHGITNRRAKASADYVNSCADWADFILATSPAEKQLLTTAPYKCTSTQVYAIGFPRHDSLVEKSLTATKKYICLQPHWAQYLKKSDMLYTDSPYFIGWTKLLNSPLLKQYSEKTGIQIAFRLHPESYKHEEEWLANIPSYIKYIDKSESFQKTFTESLLYVSDYSSNMFEVGIIDTPCIYYRPDAEFIRTQTTAGDFEKGLLGIIGPTTYTVEQFIDMLYKYTNNNFIIDQKYQNTRNILFPYKLDTHNCERIYEQLIIGKTNHTPKHLKPKKQETYLYF